MNCFLKALAAIVICSQSASAATPMSNEESKRFVSRRPIDTTSPQWEAEWWRLDPSIKSWCWTTLGDASRSKDWYMASAAIGYIGDETDVPKIITFIGSLNGDISSEQVDVLRGFVEKALPTMYYRNISDSGLLLTSMIKPQFWTDKKFDIVHNRPNDYPSFVATMTCNAMRGLTYSRKLTDPEADKAVQDWLATLDRKDVVALAAYGWSKPSNFSDRIATP